MLIKPSEKFKNVFNFDWDPSEDTSAGLINSLFRNENEPHLLFGRGIRGGVDLKEQKRHTR
jgi:ATP-dependent RNA helicase DDX23/PRP28